MENEMESGLQSGLLGLYDSLVRLSTTICTVILKHPCPDQSWI